jgi:hypothetical protein
VADRSPDRIYQAGDVVVDEIKLVSYSGFELDLRKMVGDFSIYEDIYSNHLSGSIVFPDSMNLVKNFPIIGDEELFITFYTPGVDPRPRRVRFKVFKISSFVRGTGSTTVAVRLEFVTPVAEVSARHKLNRCFKSMTFGEMVKSTYAEMQKQDSNLPPLFADDTYGQSTVIIPNWSPLYAINWFCHRSVSKQNQQIADYVFFQTLDGMNFFPLSKLKSLDSVCTFKSAPGGFRSDKGERMIESELRNITSYSIRDMGDKLRETKLGVYSSHMLVHEMTTKSYYGTVYSYRNSFNETPHMNKGRMVPYDSKIQDRPASQMKYYNKSHFMFDGIDDANYIDRAQDRQSLLNQMNALTMTIDVYGDTTLRVGYMVNLEFFSQEYTKGKDDYLDPYLSGKYMITGIMHNVVEGVHTMRVTISRDSYGEPLPDKKAKDLS